MLNTQLGTVAHTTSKQVVQPGSDVIAALKRALNELQKQVNSVFTVLRRLSTCSHEFIAWLEDFEKKADIELVYQGFEKLPEASHAYRRGSTDLPIAYYGVENIVIEVGLSGMNKCGILEELSGGKPPRVYAKIYAGDMLILALEADTNPRDIQSVHYIL